MNRRRIETAVHHWIAAALSLLVPALAWGQSDGAAEAPAGRPQWMGTLFLMSVFILIFYFLLLRPQQKRQRQVQEMLKALKRGDRVMTTGGLYGRVHELKEDVVVLQITSDGAKVEVAKSAVTAVLDSAK